MNLLRMQEPLLRKDDRVPSSFGFLILRYGKTLGFLLVALPSILALFMVPQLGRNNIPQNRPRLPSKTREHVTPTQLSVVDPQTGRFVDALVNPLYQTLKEATFMESAPHLDSVKELPMITLDKTTMSSIREPLRVSWTLGLKGIGWEPVIDQDKDILALFCPSDAPHRAFLEAATLEQVRATASKHSCERDNEWFFPSFPVTKHETCEFRLFGAVVDSKLHLLARSPVLHFSQIRTPTNLHLAFSSDPSEMVVQFSTAGDKPGTPVAQYGPAYGKRGSEKVRGTSHTYSVQDMCQEPANITEAGKFQDPGMLHVVRMKDLEPNQMYEYKVGFEAGQGIVWSDKHIFRSAPFVGYDDEEFSYVVYGDQGCPSVGWGEGGEWTAAMVAREENLRAVHHFGDLSYARGATHIWDEWLYMIEPITRHVPLMIGVGNHEYDYTEGGRAGKDPSGVNATHGFMPKWGDYGMDSGGECGVPTSNLFEMPSSNASNGVFWYSHDYATVHTVMISTEHNLTVGSQQFEWLKADLVSVNRTLTPWLVVEMHRPIYHSEIIWPEHRVGLGLRREIEDLLADYGVDLVLSGHYHSYLRTCKGLYQSKCHNGGPSYITIGSAGAILDDSTLYQQSWTEKFIKSQYGYGRITVVNTTSLHFEFVLAGPDTDPKAGTVADEVWINREV